MKIEQRAHLREALASVRRLVGEWHEEFLRGARTTHRGELCSYLDSIDALVMLSPLTRACEQCGADFVFNEPEPVEGTDRFCSESCADRYAFDHDNGEA